MENNELDDLFRSNADYLGDEPPRGFDKDAFWQHLQAELPKKAERRRRPAPWWWAAASVILLGMLGGIWWEQSAKPEAEILVAQETAPWSVSPQTSHDEGIRGDTSIWHRPRVSDTEGLRGNTSTRHRLRHETSSDAEGLWGHRPQNRVYKQIIPPETPPPAMIAIERPVAERPIPIITPAPVEVVEPVASKKPTYRVVHINEIRQRKQQEAKARSRVAFKIGISPPAEPESIKDKPSLSISIPN